MLIGGRMKVRVALTVSQQQCCMGVKYRFLIRKTKGNEKDEKGQFIAWFIEQWKIMDSNEEKIKTKEGDLWVERYLT